MQWVEGGRSNLEDMVGHSGTRRQKKKGTAGILVVQEGKTPCSQCRGLGFCILVRELDPTSILVTKNQHVVSNKKIPATKTQHRQKQ